ncbi:response regulator [Neobacillus drentensis]|uniref:response regulator transcription factor n=1 Tax=Neobacillus drentensis TaxID=220684 RepID=UPI002FFE7DCD
MNGKKTFRMMIVEDEPWIRMGLERVLTWSDYNIDYVGFASNGEEALNLLDDYQPDIIISDIKMPKMDGITFVKNLKERYYPFPKVIILSGYNDFIYTKEAIKFGVSDYILKPIDPKELKSTISGVITQLNHEVEESKIIQKYQIKNYIYEQIINPIESPGISLMLPYSHFLLIITVENTLDDLLNESKNIADYYCFSLGHSTIILLCFVEEMKSINFLNNYKMLLNKKSVMGISCIFYNINDQYKEAYKQAQFNLQSNLKRGSNQKESGNIRPLLSDQQEKELLDLLQSNERSSTFQFIVQLIYSYTSFEEQWSITFQLYTFLVKYMDSDKIIQKYQNWLYNFKFAKNLEDIESIICEIIEPLIDDILEDWNRTPSDIVIKAKEYIDEHFANPSLSLTMVSDILKLSPSHLSCIFKSELNINFISYITEKRINMAKKKLVESKNQLFIISESVGFNDVKYFLRVFKKGTGLTPKQYRELYK